MYKQAIVNNLIKVAQYVAKFERIKAAYDYDKLVGIANALVRGQEDIANLANERISGLRTDFNNLDKVNAENSRNVTDNANIARSLANKGLKTFQYGGAGVGGIAGAGLGYAGSNWLSKKLGLKGQKGWRRASDIALRTLGTAGGAAAGAYGGYRLGSRTGNNFFSTDGVKGVQSRGTYTYADDADRTLEIGAGYPQKLLDEMRKAGLDNPVEYAPDIFYKVED